jgi:hypothetical protein
MPRTVVRTPAWEAIQLCYPLPIMFSGSGIVEVGVLSWMPPNSFISSILSSRSGSFWVLYTLARAQCIARQGYPWDAATLPALQVDLEQVSVLTRRATPGVFFSGTPTCWLG